MPDFQGAIETDDRAEICFDDRGYGRAHPPGRREFVVFGTHLSDDEGYSWLKDSLAVGVGEGRSTALR